MQFAFYIAEGHIKVKLTNATQFTGSQRVGHDLATEQQHAFVYFPVENTATWAICCPHKLSLKGLLKVAPNYVTLDLFCIKRKNEDISNWFKKFLNVYAIKF